MAVVAGIPRMEVEAAESFDIGSKPAQHHFMLIGQTASSGQPKCGKE